MKIKSAYSFFRMDILHSLLNYYFNAIETPS